MAQAISEIINEFTKEVCDILGSSVSQIILYGSFARGDNLENSDIDIMVLVALPEEEIKYIRDRISDCAFDFLMDYGVEISPMIINDSHFEYWVDTLPFYRNVRDEGVALIA